MICRIDGASDQARERILPRMRDRPPSAGELSVGMILFDGVMLLDVAGPAEVFAAADRNAREAGVSRRYRVRTYGVGGGQVRSEAGVVLMPDTPLPARLAVDTLLVPGGSGLRRPAVLAQVASALARSRPRCRRIVSVCTGAYALCESGLAAGRRITTHWRFAGDLARRYPDVEVDARALHLVAGDLGSSAGITAGIDLCLALVEEDCGHSVALATARELVVYMRRSGGQDQYSEPLRLEAGRGDRVGELVARLLAQPGGDARLDVLAAQAHLSPRQLQRRVLQRYGCSVSELVARIRLHEAQRLLCGRHALAEIAGACGYVDTDAFSRAFLRQTGLRPSEWRARFAEVDRRNAFHHEPEVLE
ncbi:helix-turn-helix domain-containing protein [Luteimonas viscosa]|uniref:Helix-turn-helix domain-containing protein n=1 Tax=Luteimonas viscosa TaxID=1132694 RepID=A0A5D4XLX0_9GAMM|nr:helix-turn-helix domain-containing protein [Luteimonas viscosa]TYT24943.1 helix-turn-helix domain-containing protein [Luteimonas viscosa]